MRMEEGDLKNALGGAVGRDHERELAKKLYYLTHSELSVGKFASSAIFIYC